MLRWELLGAESARVAAGSLCHRFPTVHITMVDRGVVKVLWRLD